MSLVLAADLLRKYNKELRKPINTQSDQTTNLGVWSYANIYDALYERFQSNKNFNINMWHQSIKGGEQDTYLSLIEQNKDTQLSEQFYDPSYYNYESMMLELSLPFLDANPEKAKEQFKDVWDPRTQSIIQESLGKMTDRDYVKYQISQANEMRAAEITKQIEQNRKDNMNWFAKAGNTIGAAFAEFGEGIITALSGILDVIVSTGTLGLAPYALQGFQGNYLDAYVDYFADKGLIAAEKQTVRNALDEWERTHTYIKDIDGNMTGVGKYVAGIANSIGMMIPAILANVVLPGIGMPLFYTSIYGHNIYENAHNPATKDSPSWIKITNAAIKTGVEVAVEYGLNKMLGSTLQNQLIGLSGRGIVKEFGKFAGLRFLAKSALQEGLEEFLQDFSTNLVDQFTGMIYEGYQHTGVNFQTLIDSFAIGALSSIFMSGGAVTRNAIMSKATKGKSDVFVETADGSLEKVKGLRKLAWSSMMQDFQSAVKTLQKDKMSIDKKLDLAQEVYGGITVMTQFYQSFSTDRIVNAEKLLQRVAKAEQRQISFMGKTVMKETVADFEARQKSDINTFTDIIHKEFISMTGEVGIRYADRVKKALETVGDKLKDAGVTEIRSATDKDGTKHKKDPAITALEKQLQSKYDELNKDYDWVFTTDGHIAIETDGILFVSEAWLENYETSEIYKFLAQNQILDTILADKELAPMLKEVVKHNKSFIKQETSSVVSKGGTLLEIKGDINEAKTTIDGYIRDARDVGPFTEFHLMISYRGQIIDVTEYAFDDTNKNRSVEDLISRLPKANTTEQALMDLLFNKSVYQHFLLSNKGKNINKFKDFIFRLHDLIKTLGESQKLTKARKNYLNKIYEQIKDTMREPTIKAILNWNMNPQLVGADSILTEADKQFINQYQTRKNVISEAAKGGKITASYERIATDLRENGKFTDAEKALIDRGLLETATDNERLLAIGLLNEADIRYVNYDFDQNTQERNMSPGAFIVPKQAITTGNDLAAYIQFKADILNEFRKIYGIDARLLFTDNTDGITQEALNLIIKEMEVLGVDNYTDFVIRKLENMLGDEYIVTPTYQVSDNKVLEYVRDFEIVTKIPAEQILISNILKGTLEARNQAFVDMFEGHTINNKQARMLSEFIKIIPGTSMFDIDSQILNKLYKWTVEIGADTDARGYTDKETKTIYINTATSDDFIHNLVHEINHAIQYEYYLSRGFNKNAAFAMPDFLKHVLQNYPELIAYVLRRQGYTSEAEIITNIQVAAYVAYRLIQGELWAEHYMHNGKLVKGYTMQQAPNGKSYIVSPDGKYKFEMPFAPTISKQELSTRENIKPDPIYTQNATERTFNNIFGVRSEGSIDNQYVRNTYHSKLTLTKNAFDLTQKIINKGLPITTQIRITINDIILNPEQYLSQKILKKITSKRGEITEGTTYHFLKEWFENNIDGVSLDRDQNTHEYLFVNDNAFDDLHSSELSNARLLDNDIVLKYTSEDGFNLNRFYNVLQLTRLGLPSNIKVIANNKVKTETIVNKANPYGLININVNTSMTNAEFIDRLGHEFRHILQHNHKFEQGFTADFKVTQEMLIDLKKHVPEIFKNKDLIDIAKYNKADPDIFIAQRFIYYMMGAEQNAYGIRSALLNAKPAYNTTEAGKHTIYMPWYDAKTGEGRYQTEFLAARADDTKIDLPEVSRKPKYISVTTEKPKRVYKYNRKRSFTKAEAAGTNLQYFVKKGIPGDMDPDLKNFIIATTGKESKLPRELIYSIQKGKLTKQAFYKWFRNVDAKNINEFTFDLINKHMFKNDVIKNMTELERLVNVDVSFYWAASIVLRQKGLSLESLIAQNDVNKFIDFVNSLENSKWKDEIEKMRQNFDWYFIEGKQGKQKRVEISLDQATADYMRVFTMQYFDGTLAGAFYTARTLRHIVRLFQNRDTDVRLDAPVGDGTISMVDLITEDGLSGDVKQIGNDIIAMYELEVLGKTAEEMIIDLGQYAKNVFEKRAKEKAEKLTNLSEVEKKRLVDKSVRDMVEKFINELQDLSPEDITLRYQQVHDADMTGLATRVDITNTNKDIGGELRVNVVARINRAANRLLKYISEGRAVWENLPESIRNLFIPITQKKGQKKWKTYELKPEVYSVGKGRTKQDITRIVENAEILKQAADDARDRVFITRETTTKVRELQRKLDRQTRNQIKQLEKGKQSKSTNLKETEFNTNKRKRTIDQPNNFTIISGIDMPPILRKIFDVSFEEMANTEVQFVSRDKDGNILDKETLKDKTFEAALKHEVNSWDAFYEAIREQLLNLTRTDVLDIIEFIQMGVQTLDGPANKLAAFQIFILGYFVDGVRRNFNNWNFSDAEIKIVEELYERKASEHGSGLNAVGQMLKVIDPLKKIRQRMLEDYNISDTELEPLFKAVDKLQEEKDLSSRKQQAVEVEKEVRRIEQLMIDNDIREKGFGKRWYQKLKSARYTFMLSSPMTWIRNLVSNIVNLIFNRSADYIGKFVFTKKGYREGQWDITGTQISNEVKTFIDENIKKSELFGLLYDGTTKYDDRAKKVSQQKELFITMIVNALERKYAAEHRFDSDTANFLAKFVNRMISDKSFIKVASSRYLGKILTIEAAKGNVDLSKGLSNEVLNFFAEAVILANTEYMRKRSFLADMTDGLREKHPVAYEILNWWQPFLNSSFNWFQETLKYTPIGLAGAIWRMHKLETQITKIDARRARGELVADSRVTEHIIRRDIGKGILGLVLTTLGIMLGITGVIKIEDDDDKFYMMIGDLKIDISNIFGTSSILVGVSLAQIGNMNANDIMKYVAEAMSEGFVLKDLLDKHKWNKGAYEAMLTETESILRSFVPQFVQLIIRATNNEKIQYTSGMAGVWERWLNSWIPVQPFGDRKINPYTGEIETKYAIPFFGELLKSGLLGPKIFWSEVSEIEAFAREYGINKNELTGKLTIDGEEHIINDKETLNKKYGELNKKSLSELQKGRYNVQMPDGTYKTLSWSQMSDAQRARVIDRTMTQNSEIAKIFMWTQTLGYKYYASDSFWQILRKLGITKNVYKGGKGFVK